MPGDMFTALPLFQGQQGFGLFSSAHFCWMAVCIVVIALLVRRYRHLPASEAPGSPRRRMLLAVALVPIALLVSDDAIMAAAGVFWPGYWPLHFCNFAEYFCLWHALRPGRASRELSFMFGAAGGCMAILFANWWYAPWYSWATICGFMEHTFIFAFALMAVADPQTSPRWADMTASGVFVAAYAAFFRWFNPLVGANFGFVSEPSAGSPLVAWEAALGNPGYLVPYALLFCAGLVAVHAFLEHRRRHAT